MAKIVLENLFKGIKVTPIRNGKEFGLFYDSKRNEFWFGEKKGVEK